MKNKVKSTDIDWDRVFELRCQNKSGRPLTVEEQAFVARAYESDRTRYAALSDAVFNATKPVGAW